MGLTRGTVQQQLSCKCMYVETVEQDKMVGIMMVDLSAAFDMVDHPLLLKKLELYGIEPSVLSWVQSYLRLL